MKADGPASQFARLILEELLADPRANALLELAQNANDLVSSFRAGREPRHPIAARAPQPQAVPTPRQLLLFGDEDVLSHQIIRKRRAALAALCHPDGGGNVHVMARLNAAADELLAACEREL